jgi:pimeloyl-ACP methyl ester carboxylesterase
MPTVETGDIVTYYEEAGSGAPLVLICGLSQDLQVWRFQVPELSKHCRVISYDNRGAGRTSAPDQPYSIAGMADDLATLLDKLQVESAHILGVSMGGVIAQALALAHPERVRKLILVSTLARPDGYFRLAIRNWMNIRRTDMPFEQICRFVSRWPYSPAFYDNEPLYEKFVQMLAANPYAQKSHAFLRQADALLSYDAGDSAKNIRAQTLILAGAHDNLVPPYHSEHLAKLIAGSTRRVLNGAHLGLVEFPDEYNREVLAFLRSN